MLAAAVFFKRGIIVTEIQQAHVLLVPLLGTSMAGVLFAVALLCSGPVSYTHLDVYKRQPRMVTAK